MLSVQRFSNLANAIPKGHCEKFTAEFRNADLNLILPAAATY